MHGDSPFEVFRGLEFTVASEAAEDQPHDDPNSHHRQPSSTRQEYSRPPEAVSPYSDLQHFRHQQRLRMTSNSQVFTSPARRTFSTHFLPPFTIQIRGAVIGSDAGTNIRVIATVIDLDLARSISLTDSKVDQTQVLERLSAPGLPRDHIFQTCTSGLGRLVGNQFFEDESMLGKVRLLETDVTYLAKGSLRPFELQPSLHPPRSTKEMSLTSRRGHRGPQAAA